MFAPCRLVTTGPGLGAHYVIAIVHNFGATNCQRLRRRRSCRHEPQPVASISAAHNALPPAAVIEVPAHSGAQPVLKILLRPPAEFGPDLAGIDGIARLVPWPVGHELDQLL